MNLYLVNAGAIVSGPHDVRSSVVRRLTACGNPEALHESALIAAGLLPEVRDTLGAGQGYGAPLVEGQAVRLPAVDLPPPGPPPVPDQVTMRQARLALLGAGLLDDVTAAIDALPEPTRTAARIEWEYSTSVQRHRGLVQQLGSALGMTSEQLDALFIAAAAIP